jgi:choice-of-anchor B domain-containing protein
MGRTNGTSFVDITDPVNPVYLGNLPTATASSPWRDMKVHADHAYIVSEAPGHGMQVFDLTRLRGVTAPRTWRADTRYTQFGNAHNIAINEDSGHAYAVGTQTCNGGPHMVDIRSPKSPRNAGCVSEDGYTHDTQCVIYDGPDADHTGREICVSSNEDTVTVVDVTDKANPRQVSRTSYTGSAYTHQGWLTEDQRYFFLDDELDESTFGHGTRTYLFDMVDLDDPVNHGVFTSTSNAIDHNLYVLGNFAYQANYQAGLRVLDITDITEGRLTEHAYFDVHPDGDAAEFNGAWSNYPYFPSGTVVVSSIEGGLFVLRHDTTARPK